MTEPIELPSRRTILLGAGLTLAGVTAVAATPRRHDGDWLRQPLDALVPRKVADWRGDEDTTNVLPEARRAKRYDATVSRVYLGPDRPRMMLVVAHASTQSEGWNVHRPEVCYDWAGFAISAKRDVEWPIGGGRMVPGRMMTATYGNRVEQVGYWRRIADGFPVGRFDEFDVTVRRRLVGHIPDGLLVRMSVIGPDAAAAQVAIGEFAQALVASASPAARRLMLGAFSG